MFKNKKGFTFIELSVVILIISILFAGTSIIFSKLRNINHKNATIDKLKVIENALKTYFLENQMLPCPAGLKLTKSDTNFGAAKTDCTAEDTSIGFYISGTLIYGAIPFKELGIYSDFIYDGWGNKFSYVVNGKFIINDEIFAQSSGKNSIIINKYDEDVDDNSGVTDEIIKDDAIVLIISHGSNGEGSFRDILQNNISASNDTDQYNEYDNNYYSSFDNNFVDNFTTTNFDDILKYFDKEFFTKGIGTERIGCLESKIPDYIYTANGTKKTIEWDISGNCTNGLCEYEQAVSAKDACISGSHPNHYVSKNPNTINIPARMCLKNGQWSDVMYSCVPGCGNTSGLITALNGITSNPYTTAHLDANEPWLQIEEGEEIILKCTSTKTGTVTVKCNTGGAWSVVTGNCVDTNTAVTTN